MPSSPPRRWHALFAAAAVAFLTTSSANAFFSFGNGFASKWGDDPNFGTPAVVTWGFMPDGTTVEPDFELDPFGFPGQTGFSGTSDIGSLRERIEVTLGHGTGAFDAALQRAFDSWSAVANITFAGPITDPGLPFPAEDAVTPDIRIGAFAPAEGHSFNFVGAVGFGPPGIGDDPLAGDIIFNLDATIDIVASVEDVTPMPAFTNDLEGLFLHELGHAAIGLGHPPWEGEDPDQRVMYVGDFANEDAAPCCETINRELHADDIAGAWFTYGIRGDYNDDDVVDAADYTVWRDGLGDEFDQDDYNPFMAQFGAVRPTSDGPITTVPEPAACLLLLPMLAVAFSRRS